MVSIDPNSIELFGEAEGSTGLAIDPASIAIEDDEPGLISRVGMTQTLSQQAQAEGTKSVARAAGAVGGSLALLPGAGLRSAVELIPTISPDPDKKIEPGSLERANKVFEDIMGVPTKLITNEAEAQLVEAAMLVAKPFEWAGDAGRAVGYGLNWALRELGLPADTYLEPLMATYGEAAMVLFGPKLVKSIKNSNRFRRLTNKERGLVVQSLADAKLRNPDLTEAELLRRYNNKAWFDEALKAREIKSGAEPIADIVETHRPPIPEAEVMTELGKRQRFAAEKPSVGEPPPPADRYIPEAPPSLAPDTPFAPPPPPGREPVTYTPPGGMLIEEAAPVLETQARMAIERPSLSEPKAAERLVPETEAPVAAEVPAPPGPGRLPPQDPVSEVTPEPKDVMTELRKRMGYADLDQKIRDFDIMTPEQQAITIPELAVEMSRIHKQDMPVAFAFADAALEAADAVKLPAEVRERLDIELRPIIGLKDIDPKAYARSLADHKARGTLTKHFAGFTETWPSGKTLIALSLRMRDPDTVKGVTWHEMYHVAARQLMPDDVYIKQQRHFDNNEEIAADAFRDYMRNRTTTQPSWLRQAWDQVIAFLEKIRNWATGKGFHEPNSVFQNIAEGAYTPRETILRPSEIDAATMTLAGRPLPSQAEIRGTKANINKYLRKQRLDRVTDKVETMYPVIREQTRMTNELGGSTYSPSGENLAGSDHYAVSVFPDLTEIVPGTLTTMQLRGFYDEHRKLLMEYPELNVGTWYDAANNQTYMDLSVRIPRSRESVAMDLSKQYNQKAMFDLKSLQEIPTGGTGTAPANMLAPSKRIAAIKERIVEPPVDPDGNITLTHWSNVEGLDMIDPAHFGTAHAGAESIRKQRDPNNWVDRSYHGLAVGEPGGYVKEAGLGPYEYKTKISKKDMYDFAHDPDGFRPKVLEAVEKNPFIDATTLYEKMVKDAGYKGYWTNHPQLGMVAVTFEPMAIPDPSGRNIDLAVMDRDIKQNKYASARKEIKRAREAFLDPNTDSPLDKAAVAFLKTRKFNDYFEAMPTLEGLKPSELFKSDPNTGKLMAVLTSKSGKVKPALRQSGFYVSNKFVDSFATFNPETRRYELKPDVADVSLTAEQTMDPTRFLQLIDQGYFGGAMQQYVLWPTRMTTLAKMAYSDDHKAALAAVTDKYNINRGKDRKAVGDVIEFIQEKDAWGQTSKSMLNIPEIKKFLAKYPTSRKADIINAAMDLRKQFTQILRQMNLARRKRGQKEIPFLTGYRPHILEQNLKTKLLGNRMTRQIAMGKAEVPDFIQPNQPFNPRELKRAGGLEDYAKERDIVRLMTDYIETASKDIFDTNIVHNNKIHAATLRSMGLENAATGVERWTSEVYAGVTPWLTKGAQRVLPQRVLKGMYAFRRNLTRAVFPLNWSWNTFIQTSSSGLTPVRYGSIPSVAGVQYMLNPTIRQAVKQNAYSSILKSRWGGRMAYQDLQGSILKNKKLQAGKLDTVEEYANFLTSAIEDTLTGHAVTAAYYHGRKLGLTGRPLWEYASEGGAKTQSMYNFQDAPGFLRNKIVGVGGPFQTFAFEAFNTVREMNLPVLRKATGKAGAYETVAANSKQGKALLRKRMMMLGRFVAAIVVTNAVIEDAIGRRPWVLSSFLPFLGYLIGDSWGGKYGRGPRALAIQDYVREFQEGWGNIAEYGSWRKMRKWAVKYHMPAGVQANRVIDGIIAVSEGGDVENVRGRKMFEIDPDEYWKAILLGPYATTAGREYIAKLEGEKAKTKTKKKKRKGTITIK